MKRLRSLFLCAAAVYAVPSGAAETQPKDRSQIQSGCAQSDVTGAIGTAGQLDGGGSAIDAGHAGQSPSYVKLSVTYDEAFRNWRACALTHQAVGNPPPQCDELRLILRNAILMRPRSQTVAATPANIEAISARP